MEPGQGDAIPSPPPREEFHSPEGDYVLVLKTPEPEGPQAPRSTGELFRVEGETRKLIFRRELPHAYRPRFAAVSDSGRVLLVDEWIHVKSPYAVAILSPENEWIARHDFDAVAEVLGVPASQIVRAAEFGWWLQSRPTIEPSSEQAFVQAAGKTLEIDLTDGKLSSR